MFAFYWQLLSLIDRAQRWKLAALMVGLVVRAGVEVVGIGSIAPFMSVAADPDTIRSNEWLLRAYEWGGFESDSGFLLALGLGVIAFLALSNAVGALTTWGLLRFTWGIHHRLAMTLYRAYLAQPYMHFTERNSASFSKTVLSEVTDAVKGVLAPSLKIASRLILIVAIATLLVVLDPTLALISLLAIGGGYGAVFLLVRSGQQRIGVKRLRANEDRFRIAAEAFGGIKEVKALGREEAFGKRFAIASWDFSRTTSLNAAMGQIPKYLFETAAFGAVIALMLVSLASEGSIAGVLPIVSVYALAGYKLMPEVQNVFVLAATARFYRPALDAISHDLRSLPTPEPAPVREVVFKREVRFDNVGFQYPEDRGFALRNVSFRIPKNGVVGLMGESGSGKTTLVDLLLGLHTPSSGSILIDGTPLGPEDLRAWRKHLGYVPQAIFLSDDTLAANIAFGVPREEIDHDRVEKVAEAARIDHFIATLPASYQTVVGERGVRLSGGQRQRLGIARALYHDPDVLIFDEATSALDYDTETAIMNTLDILAEEKTVVIVAHRLRTLSRCDAVFVLERGVLRRAEVPAAGH